MPWIQDAGRGVHGQFARRLVIPYPWGRHDAVGLAPPRLFSNATVGPVRDATVSPLDALVNANVGSKDDDFELGRDHERLESSCPF